MFVALAVTLGGLPVVTLGCTAGWGAGVLLLCRLPPGTSPLCAYARNTLSPVLTHDILLPKLLRAFRAMPGTDVRFATACPVLTRGMVL